MSFCQFSQMPMHSLSQIFLPPRQTQHIHIVLNCSISFIVHPILPFPLLQNAFPRRIQTLIMSRNHQAGLPTGSPNGLAGCNCTNCRHFIKFKACQSNANGNRGCLIAMQGEPCQFFCWAPGSSKSPSVSPSIPSTPTLPLPVAPVAPVAGPTPSWCLVQGCGQTRIADDCLRCVYHKHCIEQADPAPSQPQPATMVVHTSNTSSHPLDAHPDAHFASHLLPIYVESLAREQTLELSKSKLDAEQITSAKQAAQKITVHAWRPHITEPESRQIQKGFTWLFFKLSLAILSLLGLQQSAELGALQMYDETDEYWLTIDIDHIMEVCEDHSVMNCEGFDKLFKQVSHPHLCNNLPLERAYVRNTWKALNRKATSPPPLHHFPSSVKCAADDPIELSNGDEKKWPRDCYVCDVAPCFCDARTYVRGHHACNASVIFHEHFPSLKFHSSTFSDNKALWRKAPQRLKNQYLVIGRKKAGCWSKFTAELKGSKKTQASSPEDVIELSDSN
ncbi:hypothetical protein BYT27DRAFT_7221760 [Phlegmacium glaucopus]|nr:hypothetical protein BYT27DRAFT_7221760 [Phlegmacium glaucopus]